MPRPKLVCLLPARNAVGDLPGFLESVGRFADAVVALDDGSTDGTRAVLAGCPLVEVLLENPRREGYEGWDDSANRNRLLEAAGELEPDWIISLDADERIDADDAAALRQLLARDALPGVAYGLQHYRLWDQDRFDPNFTWIYRLFAHAPGQEFPTERLHFDPVPTAIPAKARVCTTIRVKHLGSATEARRLQMLAKYREADPDAIYPTNFGGLADRPAGDLPRWQPRPRDLPVLEDAIAIDTPSPTKPKLVCLLPARNAVGDLPGFLESVGRFADAVVALDDGSTDDTRAVLAGSSAGRGAAREPASRGV